MMKLEEIVSYQNDLLRITEFEDYPNALNGLHLQNSGIVTKIAVAVDACEPVLERAASAGADLLIVHHGLLWGGLQTLIGPFYRKVKLAMANNIAIYSAHLPLDAHPRYGNNALLCDALGFSGARRTFLQIGFQVDVQIGRDLLRENLERAVGAKVHLAPGGPAVSRRVGVVTGGAGGEVAKAAAEGVDTFITGEGPPLRQKNSASIYFTPGTTRPKCSECKHSVGCCTLSSNFPGNSLIIRPGCSLSVTPSLRYSPS